MIAAVSAWWRTLALLLGAGVALGGLAVFGLAVFAVRKLRGLIPGAGDNPGATLSSWGKPPAKPGQEFGHDERT